MQTPAGVAGMGSTPTGLTGGRAYPSVTPAEAGAALQLPLRLANVAAPACAGVTGLARNRFDSTNACRGGGLGSTPTDFAGGRAYPSVTPAEAGAALQLPLRLVNVAAPASAGVTGLVRKCFDYANACRGDGASARPLRPSARLPARARRPPWRVWLPTTTPPSRRARRSRSAGRDRARCPAPAGRSAS